MDKILQNPLFGIALTLLFYTLGRTIYKRFTTPLLHPIAVAVISIIATLLLFDIPLESYKNGSAYLNRLLPLTITILAIPLYNYIALLKRNKKAIISGIIAGIICSASSIIIIGVTLSFNRETIASLLPKSITTPLGIALTEQLDGIVALAVIAIVITGILGVLLAPLVFKLFKITNPVAQGIALGTASHAVGTSKALEFGKEQGAMSSLALIITGITTILLTPLFSLILKLL